jgi:hypothetical protein
LSLRRLTILPLCSGNRRTAASFPVMLHSTLDAALSATAYQARAERCAPRAHRRFVVDAPRVSTHRREVPRVDGRPGKTVNEAELLPAQPRHARYVTATDSGGDRSSHVTGPMQPASRCRH